jgi:molybdopterin/thiamine biosynthesis adenylyltransferase
MEIIEPTRHLSMFDPAVWGDRRVDILGCGASGSHLGQEIGRLGVENLHLWDFDLVEAHNIANQLYPQAALGRNKAVVLAESLYAATGIQPVVHEQRVVGPAETPDDELGEVAFLCLDSMSSRSSVVIDRLQMNGVTQLVVDPRMGVEELRIYNFNPNRMMEVRSWRDTITPDEDSAENACQARTTIGGTAAVLAGLAVHQFLQWYRHEIVRDSGYSPPSFEFMMMFRPPMVMTR